MAANPWPASLVPGSACVRSISLLSHKSKPRKANQEHEMISCLGDRAKAAGGLTLAEKAQLTRPPSLLARADEVIE